MPSRAARLVRSALRSKPSASIKPTMPAAVKKRAVSIQRRDQIVGPLGRAAGVADLVEGAHDDLRAAHLPGLRDEPLQLLDIRLQVFTVLEGIESVDGDDPDAGLGQGLLQLRLGEAVQHAFLGEVVPDLGHLHPEVGGQLQELGKGKLGAEDAIQRQLFTRVHRSPRFLRWSRTTAPTMIPPLMICCQYAETLTRSSVLLSTPMISAPTMVPGMVPMPPAEREVPPITAAAMPSSSYPTPRPGWPEPMREETTRPASPESMPA